MTIADALKLKPSARIVLAHLERHGSITHMGAMVAYNLAELRSRIAELKKAGMNITKTMHRDGGGHPFARYTLVKSVVVH